MLVYKDGNDKKDILGFRCDLCDNVTLADVIPNKHGEFRYICPKCGHHMKEMTETETKEEETKMTNAYTVANAAKRLNCSTTTIIRGIYDGRFHDCYTETGYTGRPSWMIPSDQVEGWVTSGGFLQSRRHKGNFLSRKQVKEELQKAKAEVLGTNEQYIGSLDDVKQKTFDAFQKNLGQDKKPRMVFDPEVGKEVEVLDLLGDTKAEPEKNLNEFEKRVVRRVAKKKEEPEKKYRKVLDCGPVKLTVGRYPWEDPAMRPTGVTIGGDTDGDEALVLPDPDNSEQAAKRTVLENFANIDEHALHIPPIKPVPVNPVVRTDGGFTITLPAEMIEDMVHKQVKSEIAGAVSQLRTAFDLLNDELKKLEEAIA